MYTIANSNKQQATSNKHRYPHRLLVAFYFLLIAILSMTMVKPAKASGYLFTPPSMQYSVSVWQTAINTTPGALYPVYSYTRTPLPCSAPSMEELKACVKGSVGTDRISTYWGNFVGSCPGTAGCYSDVITYALGCSPANSQLLGGVCSCIDPHVPDDAKTSCVLEEKVVCPVPPFPELTATDLCTQSLDKGKGKDVDLACGPLDTEMVKQAQCLADKIHRLGIAYTEPSATVRTEAYQQHLVDLWEWHEVKIPKGQKNWSDEEKQACAPTVAKVKAEWDKHKLTSAPSESGSDAPHVLRKAVDIDKAVIKAMKEKVSNTTYITFFPPFCFFCRPIPVHIGDVQDYVNNPLVNPPPCKLRWGGRFKDKNGRPKPDIVHFDLFLK